MVDGFFGVGKNTPKNRSYFITKFRETGSNMGNLLFCQGFCY